MTTQTVGANITELPAVWRDRAVLLRRHGAGEAATTAEALAEELETLLTADDELLTLTAAARCCGYSEDHLGRLVRQGKLPELRAPNAPRLRHSELPAKPGWLPPDRGPTHVLQARDGSRVLSSPPDQGRNDGASEDFRSVVVLHR